MNEYFLESRMFKSTFLQSRFGNCCFFDWKWEIPSCQVWPWSTALLIAGNVSHTRPERLGGAGEEFLPGLAIPQSCHSDYETAHAPTMVRADIFIYIYLFIESMNS